MPPGNPNYPPVFSQSAVSSTIGQINDFAGAASSSMSLQSTSRLAVGNGSGSRLAAGEDPVPVVITGSRPDRPIHFPGLRETMIGAAIVQLIDELPADNPLREKIRELALDLHAMGAESIVASRRQSGRKSAKSKSPRA